jgi:hypothetical protein
VVLDRRPAGYLRQFIEMLAAGPALLGGGVAVQA